MLPLPTLFLLLFLLPGVAPPAAAQPALSLQPSGVLTMMEHAVLNEVYFNSPETDGLDGATGVAVSGDLLFVTALFQDALSVWRVNAETGFLSQTAVYQDSGVPAGSRIENVDGLVNGLDGATGVAVSGDGNLLFVTGRFSDALSVWRVNKAAGSLEQIEVYLDNERDSVEGIDGLGGASGVAVSGNLLFVTAQFPDDALSVWQVNEAAGTLRRTALYRDGVGIIDGLDGAVNVAVSDDGKLLFVTARNDKALSVWRVNAGAGSLIQTDLQRDGERGIDGLGGAWNVAVSGNLLFVTSRSPDDALSVWRVNAEAGTLIQMDLHRNGERGINSLFEPTGLAVSDDGNLLFVSAFIGSSVLSVWRVNAEAGTLSQTVVYPNRTIDGLDGANNVAVSGDLLFVTGFFSDALGVWHINNAEVSLEVPTVIRVQLDRAVAREVMVTVTAQSGARMETAAVTLSPGILSEDAIFPATTLSPGRWIFTARADPPDVLNMIAARTVVQVLPPLLSLEAQQQQFAVGNTVTLTVRAIAGVPADTNYRITALNRASPQTISPITVVHPAGSTEVTVFFPGQSLFTGQWEFSIQLPDNSPFRVGGGSTAIARIVIPLLQLVPLQDQYAVGSTVTLSVRADLGALTDATYDVIALDLASGRILSTMTVEHLANTIAQEVSFPARLFSSPGQWEFFIFLPPDSPFRADSKVVISILAPALSLQPSGALIRMGHIVPTAVYSDSPETDGLNGVRDVVASGDLLFVTAFFDDTLSVWRVNAEAGTLSQTAIYRDNRNGIDGLDGAAGVAVSDDGKLLFVAGRGDDALSVWRVNEAAESLEQIEVYLDDGRDRVAGIDGLDDANDIAVSGNLLFVTGRNDDALSVWQVNAAAGTLRRTALYRDQNNLGTNIEQVAVSGNLLFVTASAGVGVLSVWQIDAEEGTLMQTGVYRREIADDPSTGPGGLAGAEGVAVSGDGNLLFVIGHATDHLSAWRVNAEEGTLMQTALYQNRAARMREGIPVDGLFFPRGVAVSGNLLFVAADQDGALSAWQINAEEGTLIQTGLFRSVNNDPNSASPRLNGAWNVAVSGNLLFVTVFDLFNLGIDQSLSVWHINNAEVSMETPTVISMQLDLPVYREVMVTVTAQSGAEMVRANPVTLSPGILSERAVFPPGALGLGRWIFTAQANLPTVLDTGAAQTAVQVVPLLSLESSQERYAVGNTVTLTVRASPALPVAASYDIIARRISPPSIPEVDFAFTHPAGSTEVTVLIPGQSMGQWEFSIQLPDNSPFRVGGGSTATAGIAVPLLQLVPLQDQYAVGSTVTLSVQADLGAPTDATYELIAEDLASGRILSTIAVEHLANTIAQEVSFPARLFSSPGQWEFSIQLPDGSPFRVSDGSMATVRIIMPLLQLVSLQDQYVVGSTVTLSVRADLGVPTDATYELIAEDLASGRILSTIAVEHSANTIAQEVSFPARLFSSPGQWEFSILLPPGSPFRADSNLTIFILAPALSMQPSGVLTMMGHAVPTEVYRDSLATDGLGNAVDTAVSGNLLFVTANTDDALSVWQINAKAGTLTQTAVYQDLFQRFPIADVDGLFGGLSGAWDVAVSGNLLFVTARVDSSLSVWRINEMAGTLTQTARYQSNVNGIVGLDRASGVAVSGDGKLLFVTGELSDTISVWRVNAEAGTLSQTVVYRDNSTGNDGLNRAWDVAVSDNLLFVTGADDDALSVWRVNAEEGTLARTALYRNGDQNGENRIGGLDEPLAVTVSDDLLFVTGFSSEALSVWRVNAEAGTLSQTAVYRDGVLGVDGLDGARRVAVSGELLFVTGFQDNALSVWRVNAEAGTLSQTAVYRNASLNRAVGVMASGNLLFVTSWGGGSPLSVWHINNAEVPFGLPTEIRVQSDIPVRREVQVTVTAQSGTRMEAAAVTLSPDRLSADAMFSAGSLSPGRWIFTAQAESAALLDTGAARIAMQVRAPVKLTLDVPDSVTVGNTFTVTVGVPAETPLPESVSVTATLSFSAGDGEEIEGVVLTSARSSVRATFTAPDTAGRYTVAVRGADGILLLMTGTTVQVTVEPVLALDVPSAPIYRGVMFPVRVRLLGGLLEDNGNVAVTVYLRNAVTHALASTATATLSTAAPSDELSFEATPGEAVVTAYILTTEDIDQARLAPLTRAVLSLQSAAPATVFITRINADLSGDEVFDADDAVLIARGLLTRNYLARSAGGLSQLGPGAFQARLSELADFADISGDGRLNIIDLVFLTRDADATVSDLQSRVNAGDNPFAYLCGSTASNACEGIGSRHQNITLPGGIQYEAIGEVLDGLRRVPQPPILSSQNNP